MNRFVAPVLTRGEKLQYRVIVGSPLWSLNGVNIFSVNLVRGLNKRGGSANVLLTGQSDRDGKPMALPEDVPVEHLPLGADRTLSARWKAMERYLEQRAPCVYIPNHDYEHSSVAPRLRKNIAVVGVVHSTDAEHQQHAARLGRYWNAIVAVSPGVAEGLRGLDSDLHARIVMIPHGVDVPASPSPRDHRPGRPLRIVYAGRLVDYQKRVFDLPTIMARLRQLDVEAELTIIGGGADEGRLRKMCGPAIERGGIRFAGILEHGDVLATFERSDVFILTSEVEGGPLVLLEAMARGCVPVVTDIRNALTELVRDGVNGYRVPVGAVAVFAERLAVLFREAEHRREQSMRAFRTIADGPYRLDGMVDRYLGLFARVWDDLATGAYRRPAGRVMPPPKIRASWSDRLATPLRVLSYYSRNLLDRI